MFFRDLRRQALISQMSVMTSVRYDVLLDSLATLVNMTRYPSFSCLLLRHDHLSRHLAVNFAHLNVGRSGILTHFCQKGGL